MSYARVKAASHVAVTIHGLRTVVIGGVRIYAEEPSGAMRWLEYHGVEVCNGIAYVFKAVDRSYTTDRGFDYSPGATPQAPDWDSRPKCGGGLHFSPHPEYAERYNHAATRFIKVGVWVSELVPILGDTPKCKAPRVVVPCVEVDIDGQEIGE
jgi:hypothetical protein